MIMVPKRYFDKQLYHNLNCKAFVVYIYNINLLLARDGFKNYYLTLPTSNNKYHFLKIAKEKKLLFSGAIIITSYFHIHS